jgi:sugar phosphate permease
VNSSLAPTALVTGLRVFLPFALGYFLSYLYRSVNAVIAPNLSRELSLNAADLGLLTSTYFLTFAAAQIPLGILLDRFGPRRIEAALLAIAALGALLFGLAESRESLVVARGLIGLGVSACLMAALKALTLWFPPARLPLMSGLMLGAGGLGALVATAPIEAALSITDWRGVFFVLAGATMASSLIILLLVPERPLPGVTSGFADQLAGVRAVFTSRKFWSLAPCSAFIQASFMSIQGLWAGPWLRDVAGLSRDQVADHLFIMAAAVALGFVSMGALTDRLTRFGIRPIQVSLAGMALFLLLQAALVQGHALPSALLWAAFGFLGTSGALNYAIMAQSFPSHLAGRVNTGQNLLVFVGTFAAQWGMGVVINLWPSIEGRYPQDAYTAAFGTMLALQVIGVGWLIHTRKELRA